MGKTLEQPLGSGCENLTPDSPVTMVTWMPWMRSKGSTDSSETPKKNDETQQFLESPKIFQLKTKMTGWKIPIFANRKIHRLIEMVDFPASHVSFRGCRFRMVLESDKT